MHRPVYGQEYGAPPLEVPGPVVMAVVTNRSVERFPPPLKPVLEVVLQIDPVPPSVDLGHPENVNFPFRAKLKEPSILVTIATFRQ